MFDVNQESLDPVPCSICGAGGSRPLYSVPAGTLVRCAGCGNYFFDPRTIDALLERAGFELVEIDWMDLDIDRWQNVPIPPLLAFRSRVLDRTARLIGRPYRMVVYARKR